MEAVSEWDCRENAEGNLETKIKIDGDEDIREELFYAFAEAKCPILTMKKSKVSLEQVFLELTQDNGRSQEEVLSQDNGQPETEPVEEEEEDDESDL